jgi:hypothetical protein
MAVCLYCPRLNVGCFCRSGNTTNILKAELLQILECVRILTVRQAIRQTLGIICNEKVKVKVKVTLVRALRLCTGRTAHRGSRGIALLFHDHGTRRGCGVSVTPWSLFIPGKDPLPIVQEAGWAPGPVWTGA